MSTPLLLIEDLHVSTEGTPILRGLDLCIQPGEVHALMGRNGQGKTTVAQVLAGNPTFEVTQGRIIFQGKDLTVLAPEERAVEGLFVAFQHPVALPGVSVMNFLKAALDSLYKGRELAPLSPAALLAHVKRQIQAIGLPESFLSRSLNDGFSGGEKKRAELLQMAVLAPTLAVLDETDSGLDMDGLTSLGNTLQALHTPEKALLLITHYNRLFDSITPDYIHIMDNGRILHTGAASLAKALFEEGYEALLKRLEESG